MQQEPVAPPPLAADPRTWDTADVLRWLRDNDFDDFKAKFYSNGFEGRQLLALNAAAFAKQGFTVQRCEMLQAAIFRLRSTITELAVVVAPPAAAR